MQNIVDIKAHNNEEMALRFSTDILNNDVFYTDLNGFQMKKRQYYDKLPIQGNFYPITSRTFIQDARRRFTIHSRSAMGVASLNPVGINFI